MGTVYKVRTREDGPAGPAGSVAALKVFHPELVSDEITYRRFEREAELGIKIRHPNGYISYYGHLSRYGSGIDKGARVRQRQVVGYVGTTGLTTGPHLDYRLKSNGRFVDPLRVRFPRGQPVYATNRERFVAERDSMLRELDAVGGAGLTLEAQR